MTAYVITFGILGLILLAIFWTTINYKFKADNLGVNISWGQVLGQKIRKTLTLDILEAASLATQENLNIDIIQLETHKLAGGDPLKVIKEIVEHKRKGKILEYNVATSFDLGGDEVRNIWNQNNEK
jgi:uncharacterized protein YqfA (UPF0365 family)